MKTDNHNLESKIQLRRLFCKESMTVLDCFSGEREAIWTILRKEFLVKNYVALDVKQKPNRLKMDSLRFLQAQKWNFDVVDLDAYGSPWEHWLEVLKTNRQNKIVVFLTIGSSVFGALSSAAIKAMNLPEITPSGMHKALGSESVRFCLAECYKHDWIPVESKEALNIGGNARYLGIRLIKTHNGKHDYCLDKSHLQRMDGVHES